MQEQKNPCGLPSTTLAFDRSSSTCCYAQETDQTHYFNLAGASNETPHVPTTTLPPWIYCQQTPLNYVEFLAETGASEFQKEIISFTESPGSSVFRSAGASLDVAGHKPQRAGIEGAFLNNLTGSEYQILSQNSNEGYIPAVTGIPSTVPSRKTKEKAANADRRRRLRISEGLEALQELLPHSKEGSKASVLDDIIDHIKYLQFQMKELSRGRLGGESSCTPIILLEGYGRYVLHDQIQNEPLEELMGKLLEANPLCATQLLESRGLFMMPMALVEGLRPQT